jgi:fatty acid desaturase
MQVSESAPARLVFRDREEFRRFHGQEARSFAVVGLLYAVLFCALAVAYWAISQEHLALTIAFGVLAFTLIGWAQYSLGNGLHEAVHHNLKNRKSDFVASMLTAYPIGLTMGYRRVHLLHHRYLGTDRDPDRPAYINFPRTRGQFVLRLLKNASGIPATIQFVQTMLEKRTAEASGTLRSDLLWFAGVQVILIVSFWATFGNPIYYVIFWAMPVATVGKLLSSTRLMCEHGSPTHEWVVRTIDGDRWQTWLMGAFDFNYHGEHHLFPSVPYAHLERLYRRHRAYVNGHPEYRPFDGRLEYFTGGYLLLLTQWFRSLPWRTNAAS